MLFIGYFFIFLWAKVFGFDLSNKDLAGALLATDILMFAIIVVFFNFIFEKNIFKK